MKKTSLLILIAAAIGAGCKSSAPTQNPVVNQEKRTCKYICTMDKDICTNKPGLCSKCGMELVEKDTDK